MFLTIHYFIETGNLLSFETGDLHVEKSWRDDCAIAHVIFDGEQGELRAGHYRFDVASQNLVKKSDAEIKGLSQPTLLEVNRAILAELTLTDPYVDPPSDRPRTGPLAFDWRPYREKLRRLSDLPDAPAMVRAWPFRPDHTDDAPSDAIADLRSRL